MQTSTRARDEHLADVFTQSLCWLIGHKWREVPRALRVSVYSDGNRVRFSCSRCGLAGGFTT